PSTTAISTLSLHDALPISEVLKKHADVVRDEALLCEPADCCERLRAGHPASSLESRCRGAIVAHSATRGTTSAPDHRMLIFTSPDRKSTRLNSSHQIISYA